MYCSRCGRYYIPDSILDHLLEHLENIAMTAFIDAQAVLDALAADVNASGDRIASALTAANGTLDLSGLQAAAQKLAAIVPAPVAQLDENGIPVA